jgi:hypothetical protein
MMDVIVGLGIGALPSFCVVWPPSGVWGCGGRCGWFIWALMEVGGCGWVGLDVDLGVVGWDGGRAMDDDRSARCLCLSLSLQL